MLSGEELYEEIDRALRDLRIDFVVHEGMREFSYQDVPAAVKVLTDDAGPFVAVGAVALCEIQTDREGVLDEIGTCLDRLRAERPDLRFQFLDDDKVVWVVRFIEIEDFTFDLLVLDVDEVTTPAPEIGRELRDRLATGVPGYERRFMRLDRATERQPRERGLRRREISNELFVHWLNHILGPPGEIVDSDRGTAPQGRVPHDTSSEDVDEDIKEARKSLGLE